MTIAVIQQYNPDSSYFRKTAPALVMALNDFDLVLFGGGGDLASRKLIPALYSLHRSKVMPPSARILSVGRHNLTIEQFLQNVNQNARPHVPEASITHELWESFLARFVYVSMDANNADTYKALSEAVRNDANVTRVFYLATPPNLFATICNNLAKVEIGRAHV